MYIRICICMYVNMTFCSYLCRNQIEVLNIEKENLQINVSKIMDDKDKLATEVDIDHDELTRRAQELLRCVNFLLTLVHMCTYVCYSILLD